MACNTTNSLALDVIQKYSAVPVFDLINSFVDQIQFSRIGVLATPSTVASMAYTKKILSSNPAFILINLEKNVSFLFINEAVLIN